MNNLASKRIDAPGCVSKRNRIDMARKTQRELAADISCPCNEIGAIRSEGLERGLESGAVEDSLQVHYTPQLIPWRINRIEGNEFA